jgi:hypothetical protein
MPITLSESFSEAQLLEKRVKQNQAGKGCKISIVKPDAGYGALAELDFPI